MIIPVTNVGDLGIIADRKPHEIPLNAWTNGQNVRFRNGAVEKFTGHSEIFPTPLWAPYWLLPVPQHGQIFWLYASLTKVGATNMVTHADITRAVGGDYAATEDVSWTGDILGGIPVISNGVDLPQMWNVPDLAQRLAVLTNWPALTTCNAIRAFKQFLIALDVSKSGVRYPRLVKWSHPADPGAVPVSWDETDPTKDAGEYELSETGDFLIDASSMRDFKVLYKEYSTWGMQFVGGNNIFRFFKIFDSFGSFNRRCSIEFFNGKQLVFTGDDIVLHDGQNAESLLQERLRLQLANTISATHYKKSFVAVNYSMFEVWTCFPETGNTHPNRALVWNWKNNTWGFRDLPTVAYIASGIADPVATSELWSGAVGTWATDLDSWGDKTYDPSKRKMIAALPNDTKLMLLNDTQNFNGSDMASYVQREGIGFPLKKDTPPDYTTIKQLSGLWPRIEGTDGGTIFISIGVQQRVDGLVTWGPQRAFVIGQTEYIDCTVTGRLHALKFESNSNIEWRLHGYDADVKVVGRH